MLLEAGDVGSMTHLGLLAALPGMFLVGEIRRDSAALEQTSGAAPVPRGQAGERCGAVAAARWHPPGPRPGEAVGDPVALLSSNPAGGERMEPGR